MGADIWDLDEDQTPFHNQFMQKETGSWNCVLQQQLSLLRLFNILWSLQSLSLTKHGEWEQMKTPGLPSVFTDLL